MAKTRLTNNHRDILGHLARELVSCPVEKQADIDAYAAAAPLVRKMVEDVQPPKDMKVLQKYGCANIDDCIRLSLSAGGYTHFYFEKGKGPLTTSCKTFLSDEATTAVVNARLKAAEALKKATEAKLSDYYSLIQSSKTFEEVLEIWPEAERLRQHICGSSHALVTLNPEIAARIQQDVATRQAA